VLERGIFSFVDYRIQDGNETVVLQVVQIETLDPLHKVITENSRRKPRPPTTHSRQQSPR